MENTDENSKDMPAQTEVDQAATAEIEFENPLEIENIEESFIAEQVDNPQEKVPKVAGDADVAEVIEEVTVAEIFVAQSDSGKYKLIIVQQKCPS